MPHLGLFHRYEQGDPLLLHQSCIVADQEIAEQLSLSEYAGDSSPQPPSWGPTRRFSSALPQLHRFQ